MASDDRVILKPGTQRLDQFADELKQEPLAAVSRGRPGVFRPITIYYTGVPERYYRYGDTHRVQTSGKHRLVINHRQTDLSDDPVFLLANRRHRWPVAVYHEEGQSLP